MIRVLLLRTTLVYDQDVKKLPARNPIPFDRPANYQIKVQGRLDPTMSDLLGGLTILPDTLEADPPVITLYGELSDQAALAGVLNMLYELHLTVIMVKRLEI